MKLAVTELASKAKQVELLGEVDARWLSDVRSDVLSTKPIHVKLVAHGVDGRVHVQGQLELDVEFQCARCLEPVKYAVVTPYDDVFMRAEATNAEQDQEEVAVVVEEDVIELDSYLDEHILLALPFKPLCKEDCLGLCPTCGADLNKSACSCAQQSIDPRLAALQHFFDKEN